MPELKAKFTADTSQFISKLNETKSQLSGFKGVFGGIIGGTVVHKVMQFAGSVANVAGELADASDALGVAVTDLQALQVFAIKAGLPLEKLEAVLNRIGAASIDAIGDPAGEAAKKFAALGISVKQLAGMSEIQRIAALGKQMDVLAKDEAAMSAASEIIGIKSPRAKSVIRDYGVAGPGGAKAMAQEFIMADDAVKTLDKAMDKLDLLIMQAKSESGNLAADMINPAPQKSTIDVIRSLNKTKKPMPQTDPGLKGFFSDMVDIITGPDNPQKSLSEILKVKPKPAPAKVASPVGTTDSFFQGTPPVVLGKEIKDAMERQLKTASQMTVSDPFAAVGRAAGRDSVSDTLGTLRKIEENTRRIQPTPAPLMR